jgi:hypothetical protein
LKNDEIVWKASHDGSADGQPIFTGTAEVLSSAGNTRCHKVDVRAAFWSPAADRLRVCPDDVASPSAEPHMDTASAVDASPNCTDFRRTKISHVAADYISKLARDTDVCPGKGHSIVGYSATIRRVSDDPALRVKVWLHKPGSRLGKPLNHQKDVPKRGTSRRVITLPWKASGAVEMKVMVRAAKKTYTRSKSFKACHK